MSMPKSHDQGPDPQLLPVEYSVVTPSSGDRDTKVLIDNEVYDGITRRPISKQLSRNQSQGRRIAYMLENGATKVSVTFDGIHLL